MFAYIPARSGSKRIPKKNIYKLGGIPLLVHVIKNLQKINFLSEIFVSTDCDEIKSIAEKNNAKCLDLRSQKISDHKSGFIELIKYDLPRYIDYCNNDSEVLFTLATAALVTPEIFTKAYKVYKQTNPDILMTCEEYSEPIWWAMKEKDDGYLKPIYPEMVLKNSQDFEKTYTDSGLFYFFDQTKLSKYNSHKIVKKLKRFEVPFKHRCDVNNTQDLEVLELKYKLIKNK